MTRQSAAMREGDRRGDELEMLARQLRRLAVSQGPLLFLAKVETLRHGPERLDRRNFAALMRRLDPEGAKRARETGATEDDWRAQQARLAELAGVPIAA